MYNVIFLSTTGVYAYASDVYMNLGAARTLAQKLDPWRLPQVVNDDDPFEIVDFSYNPDFYLPDPVYSRGKYLNWVISTLAFVALMLALFSVSLIS